MKNCKPFIDKHNEWIQEEVNKGKKINSLLHFKNSLNDLEWQQLDEILAVMHPCYIRMKQMQNEAITLSEFYGVWLRIEMHLLQMMGKPNNQVDLAHKLNDTMNSYKAKVFSNPLMLCAIFLDPRYSCTLEAKKMLTARSKLIEIFERIRTRNEQSYHFDDFGKFIAEKARLIDTTSSSKELHEITKAQFDLIAIEKELNELQKYPQAEPGLNILQFWNENNIRFPKLYSLAMLIMAIPSSQTSIERNFSSLTFILNPLRTKLSSKLLENILLIRSNKELYYSIIDELIAKA